jgi:hypothetical protein
MPICTRCEKEFIESEFNYSHRAARKGRAPCLERKSHCRECRKLDGKEYRLKRHDKLRLSAQEYRAKHGLNLAEKSRIFKKNFPEYHKNSIKKHRLKLKLAVISHYSNGNNECACCGETHIEFLTLHHINGNGKNDREIHGNDLYRWLTKNNFPIGYQILCFNCNCAEAFFNGCPHKKK